MTNPILHREVITGLRKPRTLAMQIVYLLVLIAIVYLYWPESGLQSVGGSQGQQLRSILALGQFVLVALFAPAFTATALTYEKERNTFESLFATRLKPWELTFGKMAGALSFLLLLVVTGAPVLAALPLLGGVKAGEVLAVVGLLLVTCVYLGAIGLLISARSHRSYRSIITTYAVLLFVCVFTAALAWPMTGNLIGRVSGPAAKAVHVIASASPLQAMLSLVAPDSPMTRPAAGMPAYWKVYLVVAAVVVTAVTFILFDKLRKPVAPPRPRERLKVVERGQISGRTFLFLFDPAKRKPMIRWWQNPVAIKEFRTRPMLQIQWLLRMAAVCLMASFGLIGLVTVVVSTLVSEGGTMIDRMLGVVAALQVVLIILIGPAMSAGSVCADRETGVWDLMRASRLRSRTIVLGKLQASILPLMMLVLAMTPALLILPFFVDGLGLRIQHSLTVIGMTMLFVTSLGMCFSSLCSRTSQSTAWTYGTIMALSMFTLFVLLGGDFLDAGVVRSAFLVNPIAAVLDAAGMPLMGQDNLMMPHLRIMAAATAILLGVSTVRVWQLCRAS